MTKNQNPPQPNFFLTSDIGILFNKESGVPPTCLSIGRKPWGGEQMATTIDESAFSGILCLEGPMWHWKLFHKGSPKAPFLRSQEGEKTKEAAASAALCAFVAERLKPLDG